MLEVQWKTKSCSYAVQTFIAEAGHGELATDVVEEKGAARISAHNGTSGAEDREERWEEKEESPVG